MKVRTVQSKEDIVAIAKLAKIIWTEHYTSIIGKRQVEYMLSNIQSPKAISEQIKLDNYTYFLMTHDGTPAGYAAIQPQKNALLLSKLYVHRSFRGRGFARKTLVHIEKFAKKHLLQRIYLNVSKKNLDSISAYRKLGFRITSKVMIDIGNGFFMDDFRMSKPLKP